MLAIVARPLLTDPPIVVRGDVAVIVAEVKGGIEEGPLLAVPLKVKGGIEEGPLVVATAAEPGPGRCTAGGATDVETLEKNPEGARDDAWVETRPPLLANAFVVVVVVGFRIGCPVKDARTTSVFETGVALVIAVVDVGEANPTPTRG